MILDVPTPWKTLLANAMEKEYFKQLLLDIEASYLINDPPIYPTATNIYRALDLCPPEQVKVVILGQDPYHGKDQATGLAFSVPDGVNIPPSLQNIYKEMSEDLDQDIPHTGTLEHWAEQGVLLLNTTLTVEAGNAGSHQGKGWEQFTDAIIEKISQEQTHIVFLLWGKQAQHKSGLIDESKHLILTAPHPSPLSVHRGFFGCKHFSQTNNYLQQNSTTGIKW